MTSLYVGRGDVLEFTNGGTALASGAGFLANDVFGVAAGDVAANGTGQLHVEGIHKLPKASGDTPAFGAKLYWDDTAKNVTTTAGSNPLIGFCATKVTVLSGDATVPVRLVPMLEVVA